MSPIPDDSITPEAIFAEYQHLLLKRRGIFVSKTKAYKNFSDKPYYKTFVKLAYICTKYNIDPSNYLAYIFEAIDAKYMNHSVLLNIGNIRKYGEHIKIKEQYDKIYNSYMNTVRFIAKECKEKNFQTCIEYLKYLIYHKKFAAYFVAGALSKYWIISIIGIEKIISSLDTVDRDSFQYIVDNKNKFYDDIQQAFILKKSSMVKTLKFTDDFIEKMS